MSIAAPISRNIDVFAQLPHEIRRHIVLLIRQFADLGYKLMRPHALDLRRVLPVNDFEVPYMLSGSENTEILFEIWVALRTGCGDTWWTGRLRLGRF